MNSCHNITIKDIKIVPVENLIEKSQSEILEYKHDEKILYKSLYKKLKFKNNEDIEDVKIIIRHHLNFNIMNDKYRKKFSKFLI